MSAVRSLLHGRRQGRAKERAQAWYNDLLGGVHFVGDKVLRAFGAGQVSDMLSDAEGDELPDWSRTSDQKKAREAATAAEKKQQEQDAAQKKQQAEAAAKKQPPADPQEAERKKQDDSLQQQLAEACKQADELKRQLDAEQQKTRDRLDAIARSSLDSPGASADVEHSA
jgi:flagellar biosynthesis GTPase FlhF